MPLPLCFLVLFSGNLGRETVQQIHINMMVGSGTGDWKGGDGRKGLNDRECGLRMVRSTENLKTFRAQKTLGTWGRVFAGCY